MGRCGGGEKVSIKDLTITDQNVQGVLVVNQPDRLTGTAEENKKVFDAFPQLIRKRFNELLELLTAESGAGEIPVGPIEGVTAETVQQALEAIQQNLTAYINKIKAATGAAEVGVSQISGMQAQNVQKALEELRKAIEDSVSGIIPGGTITPDMLAGPIPPEKGGTGEKTTQAAIAALGAGVQSNILDNSIFIGGGTAGNLPVNQRGKMTYSAFEPCVDRWKLFATGEFVLAINTDYISLNLSTASVINMSQFVENYSFFKGKTLTFSALVRGKGAITVGVADSSYIARADYDSSAWGLMATTFTLGDDIIRLEAVLQSQGNFDVKAAKIEIGDRQTLAYQDNVGNWNLLQQQENDYATQLLKCQRYFQLYSSAEERPDKAVDCRPVMRIDPTPGTIKIGEQTYYYNSAEM